uniref:MD-2-related lipid-recognition domain-containing protein n=1 Tax=Lutzomyia longipalpis TaxID=7200 RepID=A0A1B0CJX2_LUTLO
MVLSNSHQKACLRIPEQYSELACTIHAVRINPCPEAAKDLPCKIKRGRSASIEFDYSSEFRATELDSRVYWSNEGVDLPLIGVDTNGCNIVTCPIEANINNTYTWTLNVSKKFPIRQFDIKMKIKNEDENFLLLPHQNSPDKISDRKSAENNFMRRQPQCSLLRIK